MATVRSKYQGTPASIRQANATPDAPERIHYLDNLRALAMLLGVFLHGAFAYAHPAQTFWLATDTKSSVAIDATIWFVHLFRMGLFFLLSGYFAKVVVERKGMKNFLWNRTQRLVFPMVLFYPFLLAAMTLVIAFGLSFVEEPKGLMGLIAAARDQGADSGNRDLPGTMHLWFLYYLILFSLIAPIASRIRWVSFDWLFNRPWILALAPLALIPGVMGAGVPLPGPESFIPRWWPFAFYGLYYLAGWQLVGRESKLEVLRPWAWYIVAVGLSLFIPYYWCMPVLDLTQLMQEARPLPGWALAGEYVLTAYLSVLLTLASLLLGREYLSGKSPWLKFVADSSYWVYLIHLPIAIFLQTLLIPWGWNVWFKLAVTTVGTFAFCLASYTVFVRYTPIGWLLHGKRSFP